MLTYAIKDIVLKTHLFQYEIQVEKLSFRNPFITQIYPFKVDQIGVHTEIMGATILFKFVTPVYQKDLSLLQNTSISRQINVIECNNPKY